MQSQSGPDEGLYNHHAQPQPDSSPVGLPPRPPSANPWDVQTPPPVGDKRLRQDFAFERRAPVAAIESPVEPLSPPLSPYQAPRFSSAQPQAFKVGSDRSSQQSDEVRLSPSGPEISCQERSYTIFPSQRGRLSNPTSVLTSSIPENVVSNRQSPSYKPQMTNRLPPPRTQSLQYSRPESLESDPSSMFDRHRPEDINVTTRSERPRSAGSTISAAQSSPTLGSSELSPTSPTSFPINPVNPVNPVNGQSQEALKAVQSHQSVEADYGPIPVESETVQPEHPPNTFAIDTKLNPQSSFYLHKGFCDGAQEVMRGGIGIRKAKVTVRRHSFSTKFLLLTDMPRASPLLQPSRDVPAVSSSSISTRLRWMSREQVCMDEELRMSSG